MKDINTPKNSITSLLFNLIIMLSFGITLASCQKEESKATTYHISFDDVAGFIKDPTIINSTIAHSGLNCIKINKDLIYGPAFTRKIGDLSTTKIKKIKIKAWFRQNTSDGFVKLACVIDNDTIPNVFWNALESKNFNLKPNEWGLVSGEFEISKFNDPNYIIKIFPIFQKGDIILYDDLEFSFE